MLSNVPSRQKNWNFGQIAENTSQAAHITTELQWNMWFKYKVSIFLTLSSVVQVPNQTTPWSSQPKHTKKHKLINLNFHILQFPTLTVHIKQKWNTIPRESYHQNLSEEPNFPLISISRFWILAKSTCNTGVIGAYKSTTGQNAFWIFEIA